MFSLARTRSMPCRSRQLLIGTLSLSQSPHCWWVPLCSQSWSDTLLRSSLTLFFSLSLSPRFTWDFVFQPKFVSVPLISQCKQCVCVCALDYLYTIFSSIWWWIPISSHSTTQHWQAPGKQEMVKAIDCLSLVVEVCEWHLRVSGTRDILTRARARYCHKHTHRHRHMLFWRQTKHGIWAPI